MNKKILLGIGLTLASFQSLSAVENNNVINCEDNSITQLIEKMKTYQEFFSKNPFHNNCSTFLINKIETHQLTIDHFDGSRALYNNYLETLKSDEFFILPLYDAQNGKYYHFYRIDEESPIYKNMKQYWTKKSNYLKMHFDDFMKLHELAHLDVEASRNLDVNSNETLADISAVVLLSFREELTVKKTIDFLSQVREQRKRDARGFVDYRNQFVKDKTHLSVSFMNMTINDLNKIKDKDQLLKNIDLFINIKEEDVVKFIRDRYRPNINSIFEKRPVGI